MREMELKQNLNDRGQTKQGIEIPCSRMNKKEKKTTKSIIKKKYVHLRMVEVHFDGSGRIFVPRFQRSFEKRCVKINKKIASMSECICDSGCGSRLCRGRLQRIRRHAIASFDLKYRLQQEKFIAMQWFITLHPLVFRLNRDVLEIVFRYMY